PAPPSAGRGARRHSWRNRSGSYCTLAKSRRVRLRRALGARSLHSRSGACRSLAGSMLPFILKRIGFDPASASAPFVATLVDVTGLVIYFSIALVFLRGTLL